jgi:ribosome assembly protein RRB1
VWQPGVDGMEDGEELQFDPTAYDCLHAFHLGWPCLRYEHFCLPGLEGLM